MCNSNPKWDGKKLNKWGASILTIVILHTYTTYLYYLHTYTTELINNYSIMYYNIALLFLPSPTSSSSMTNHLHQETSCTVVLYNNSYLKSVLALSYCGIIYCSIALMELFIVYYLLHQLLSYFFLLIILFCAIYFSFMWCRLAALERRNTDNY